MHYQSNEASKHRPYTLYFCITNVLDNVCGENQLIDREAEIVVIIKFLSNFLSCPKLNTLKIFINVLIK